MPPALFPKTPVFPTTHWTQVRMVQQGTVEDAAHAMEQLCKDYWYPVYAFLRRSGHGDHDAEDLTQVFFQHLVTDQAIQSARKDAGKLRTFLLGVLMRLLSNHTRHHAAQKRGGGIVHLSFDEMNAEERYAHEPVDGHDPEWIFSHAWAQELVTHVREKLRETFIATGREQVFELLLPFLVWDAEPPSQKEIAQKLGSSEAAVRVLVHRVRGKFRDLLRSEVIKTVLSPEEVASELVWLQNVLGGK